MTSRNRLEFEHEPDELELEEQKRQPYDDVVLKTVAPDFVAINRGADTATAVGFGDPMPEPSKPERDISIPAAMTGPTRHRGGSTGGSKNTRHAGTRKTRKQLPGYDDERPAHGTQRKAYHLWPGTYNVFHSGKTQKASVSEALKWWWSIELLNNEPRTFTPTELMLVWRIPPKDRRAPVLTYMTYGTDDEAVSRLELEQRGDVRPILELFARTFFRESVDRDNAKITTE